MKIHHFRNATLIIESGDRFILVDPMLCGVGKMTSFSWFRFKSKKNPLVPLPDESRAMLDKVSHCLITHKHPDHLDRKSEIFLKKANIPVTCSEKDKARFGKKGLRIEQTLTYWKEQDFLGGKITGIPARHGYGFIAIPMGPVMGYYIELPDEPTLYISGDTIYTEDVHKVLTVLKPDIAVVACGTAQLDIGRPLLMRMDDIVRFVRNATGKVMANHLEALNHCPTTRSGLGERILKEGLAEKAWIPEDGESRTFTS